ncbi:MAG: MFS transporter [Clostridium sp.]|nr:MFS transporter [Clostridium sp.]
MKQNYKKYIIFWLSQTVSQLGSQITGFALILWAYSQSHSALTVSLMSFFNYVPYILTSLVAGAFVDRHSKKKIMLVSDTIAAACSVSVLVFSMSGGLQIVHIYIVNFVIGWMNAFQGPASAVAVGKMVPEEKLAQVSGMNSFSGNLIMILAPVLSASLFAFGGLTVVLFVDLASFAFAFAVLLLLIQIPEDEQLKDEKSSLFEGCAEGFRYLARQKAIFTIILTMALLNFFKNSVSNAKQRGREAFQSVLFARFVLCYTLSDRLEERII